MSNRFIQIEKCYEYLQAHAGKEITFKELLDFTGWAESNLSTNISKRIREFLDDRHSRGVPIGDRTYYVNRNILNVSIEDFHNLFRQKNWIFSQYEYNKHEKVRIYDFYLPLTNENLLRQNLDELFFKDTLKKRLQAINLDELLPIYPLMVDEKRTNILID